jgi:hypothetical protein
MKTKNVMRPNKKTLFLRYFFSWQIYRFLVINTKMLKMMSMGH